MTWLNRASADRASICVTGACAVHCLSAPLIAGLTPLSGPVLESPVLENGFLALSLVVSALTLLGGCVRRHGRWPALAPFVAGAGTLLTTRLMGAEDIVSRAVVLGGAGMIVYAHVWNMGLCRAGGSDCGRLLGASEDAGDRPRRTIHRRETAVRRESPTDGRALV